MREPTAREQMGKTAATVQEAFHDTRRKASIYVGEGEPHLVLRLDGIGDRTDGHPTFHFPASCRTVEDVGDESLDLAVQLKRIQQDVLPECFDANAVGKRLGRISDTCYALARYERLEETADAIGTVFRGLGLENDAEIWVEGEKYGESYLMTRICNIEKDETYELPVCCVGIAAVADEMRKMSLSYDTEEEKRYYTPGENGAPEEPEFTQEFKYIQKMYEHIADACATALQVEQKKFSLEDACKERLALWKKQEKEEARRDCRDFLYQMEELHDLSPKETMHFIQDVYAESFSPRLGGLDAESMKERILAGVREVITDLQYSGASDKEIDKALGKARKELPSLTPAKPAGR